MQFSDSSFKKFHEKKVSESFRATTHFYLYGHLPFELGRGWFKMTFKWPKTHTSKVSHREAACVHVSLTV